MFKSIFLAAVLSAAVLMGGCAGPELQKGRTTPAVFEKIPASNLSAIRKAKPTLALVLDVIGQPAGQKTPVTVRLSQPGGTLSGGYETGNKLSALSDVTLGIGIAGKIGGALATMGTAEAIAANNPGSMGRRLGFLPVVSEPTLDFYRPLTKEEQAIALLKQQALFSEETGLISAVRHGVVPKQCDFGPCIDLLATYSPNAPEARYTFRPENPALLSVGDGGTLMTDRAERFKIPDGLPVGDNGFIQYGIDLYSGMAVVLPGVLPGNTYYSEEKLADLVKRYPAAAHWYAVFNQPTPGGKPGQVTWTVMREGQVVGTGEIVVQ